MITQKALGTLNTPVGNYIFTKQIKAEMGGYMFVGVTKQFEIPMVLEPVGSYVVEYFAAPKFIQVRERSQATIDFVNRMLEDARLSDEVEREPEDLEETLREF